MSYSSKIILSQGKGDVTIFRLHTFGVSGKIVKFVGKASTKESRTTCTESEERSLGVGNSHFAETNKRGFTVIELMISIIIFTLGFLGAYLLIDSARNISVRSSDEIIGANIMREQIELIKNLRDTNWIQFNTWDSLKLVRDASEPDTTFGSGVLSGSGFYTINNRYDSLHPDMTISVKKISAFSLDQGSIIAEMQKSASSIRLCIDNLGRYNHVCSPTDKKTNYASFIQIEPLMTKNTSTNTPIKVIDAYKVTASFMSINRGYRLMSMSTIITNWKNQ